MSITVRGPIRTTAAAAFLCLALAACTSTEGGSGKPAADAGTAASSPVATDTATGSASPTDTPSGDDSASPSGSDSDRSDVADVVERFLHAFGQKDGSTACGLMTDELQANIGSGTAEECGANFPARAAAVGAAELGRLAQVSVDASRVEVTGETAHVPSQAISAPGATNTESGSDSVSLTLVGSDWKISGIGG